MARSPGDHIRDHGSQLHEVILALENCFRVKVDSRPHRGESPSAKAYRADCHYYRGATMRIDFNLVEAPDGKVILVVTAFLLEK